MTENGIQVPDIRDAIIWRDGMKCRYCDLLLHRGSADTVPAIDHMTPRCQGGSDAIDNLVTACRSCNSKKGGRTPEEAGMVLLPERVPVDWYLITSTAIHHDTSENEAFAWWARFDQVERKRREFGPPTTPKYHESLRQCTDEAERRFLVAMIDADDLMGAVEESDDRGVRLTLCVVEGDSDYKLEVWPNHVTQTGGRCAFALLAFPGATCVFIGETMAGVRTETGGDYLPAAFSYSEVMADPYRCARETIRMALRWRSTVNGLYALGWSRRGRALVCLDENEQARLAAE